MKRRDFLVQAAASGLYAGTFGTDGKRLIGSVIAAEGNGTQEDSLELKFADFALSVRYEDLPKEVITSAKRVLLDTLACAFGAVGSEPGRIAEQTIRKTFGEGEAAGIIGHPRRATVEGALFVNGVLVRSLDLNDTYIGTDPLHPSEVLPTALALCEESGRGGRELIEAVVAGYEAACASTTRSPLWSAASIPCVPPLMEFL